ncbi:DUF1018 domain-containing protein [Aliivibrio finisterrensis]|uniref:DUF1018 domain-containing protein n=1 Tax=Aliivibrio finisterrensis TaxID=511998 RepID=A0A4V1Z6C3_9GAMM|nr:phage protein GemA/Gp16 family protein [Aliivibrio finisterrensis]RYU41320.1 DUF1018 domain-containing protein [Aliivibrio finisterrensis]
MKQPQLNKVNRTALYGLVHKGVKALLTDRMGFCDDDEYRNYLSLATDGKVSCKDMSDAELKQLVSHLTNEGYLNKFTPHLGGNTAQQPTGLQWAKLAALAKARGWSGLNDKGLDAFVMRTVKVERARWLTRSNISDVITGLERWVEAG